MTVPDTPAFAKDDRVQIHKPGSVLHGLAGTVVDVDHTSVMPYRVLIDGDTYPVRFPEQWVRAE